MEQKLSIEVKEKMSDYDFIELGFKLQERFFRPGLLTRFVQGDFVFRFSQKTFILRVTGDKAKLLVDEHPDEEHVKLDLFVKNEATWIKMAQKSMHPLTALLGSKIKITTGGLKNFFLYGICFTRPYSSMRIALEKKTADIPKIDRMQQVVVFNATPRQNSATRLYLKPFVAGMESAGAKVKIIDVYDKNIKQCRGCFTCWLTTPGRCIYQDDMAEIIKELENCDIWVLSFPTYCGGIPSGLQKTLERCFGMVHPHNAKGRDGLGRHPRRNMSHSQYMAGLNVYGFAEREQSKHLDDHLRDVAEHACFDYVGLARVSNCIAKALNRQEERTLEADLAILHKLGQGLVMKRKLERRLLKKLNTGTPFTLNETYHTNSVFLELMMEQNARETAT